jgi:hypothetical protein
MIGIFVHLKNLKEIKMFDTIKPEKEITLEEFKKLIRENIFVFGEIEIEKNEHEENTYNVIDRDYADTAIGNKDTKISKEDKDMSTPILDFILNKHGVIVLINQGWRQLHVGNYKELQFLLGLLKTKIVDIERIQNR